MKVYTRAEYNCIERKTLAYEQINSNLHGFDEVSVSKSQWSKNRHFDTDLSLGTKLDLIERQIYINHSKFVEHAERQHLTAKFYLSGHHSVVCPGVGNVPAEYSETGGQNYLFYLPYIEEIEQFWQGDRFKMLKVQIDLDTIRKFFTELNTIPTQLQVLIEKNPPRFYFNVGNVTTQMQTTIQQIWHHPYQDAIARMYLEGKVFELFAMQLAQLTESKPDELKTTFKPQSIDRIYQAREILVANLENPPSMVELAQQVGVSGRTLRRGFKELFNTTVVGYLTTLRMEQAERYLRERELSISEVANLVGYSHLSYFSTAFKRQFGITPSQCLAGKKPLSN